ncbi:Type I inositol 1,4,5-trisphosphate 5-phosphatase CVP2 [Platanthera zijinensis]|uniref:Type I inositol 1,4,5-trisphosphate 5-phosphatase CVP2 n=1 Tax=Platanthera zijinensis TaxID=2320716 RepID=A0AAP0FVQ7_9ASPA
MTFLSDQIRKYFAPKAMRAKEKRRSKENMPISDPNGGSNACSSSSPFPTAIFGKSCSEKNSSASISSSSSRFFFSPQSDICNSQTFRIFASTWNVGGNSPRAGMNLNDFLPLDDGSDIYVLGFQEIVPLNAGNVLVLEDKEPAAKWIDLVEQALNRPVESPVAGCPAPESFYQTPRRDFKTVTPGLSLFQKPFFNSTSKTFRTGLKKQLKACNCPLGPKKNRNRRTCFSWHRSYDSEDEGLEVEDGEEDESFFDVSETDTVGKTSSGRRRYCCIVRKKMVGIFVTVWTKKELVQHISHLRISCVGRGIMGRLGNKGCISVSMSLHQTSFCFICSHLASGEKEGDELRRNSDVMKILRSTAFRRICKSGRRRNPSKILDHDRVIWLGDLNYRIALSYSETKRLLEQNNWDALLENDQLRIEREAGRVFNGWKEGKIYFAPTYKYSNNSDSYSGENIKRKSKRRTPAWCDRILWHGDGITQLVYVRGESKLSDHRPVFAAFSVDAEVLDERFRKELTAINMKVGVEELLPSI